MRPRSACRRAEMQSALPRSPTRLRMRSRLARARRAARAPAGAPAPTRSARSNRSPGCAGPPRNFVTAELAGNGASACAILNAPLRATRHDRTCAQRWDAKLAALLREPGATGAAARRRSARSPRRRWSSTANVALDRTADPADGRTQPLPVDRKLLDARELSARSPALAHRADGEGIRFAGARAAADRRRALAAVPLVLRAAEIDHRRRRAAGERAARHRQRDPLR